MPLFHTILVLGAFSLDSQWSEPVGYAVYCSDEGNSYTSPAFDSADYADLKAASTDTDTVWTTTASAITGTWWTASTTSCKTALRVAAQNAP